MTITLDADFFWYGKAIVAFIAAVLLMVHMFKNSDEIKDWDQRCRYIILFGYVALVAVASPEQAGEDIPIQTRNVMSFVLSAFSIYTAIISMRASARRKGPSRRA